MTPERTVDAAFRAAIQRLNEVGIDTARLDARLLLGHVLGGGPERVLAEGPRALTRDEAAAFEALLARRERFEPMSHILGRREFWSLNFKVTNATLTPRADTETLIEAVLDHAENVESVLDLGTGTGCIVLTLLSEWPQARGTGVDASPAALAVAHDNAKALGLSERARFVPGDWTKPDGLSGVGGPFDVVVSNPPYISKHDIDGLDPDVRDYEPREALDGGADGLEAYRAIIGRLGELLSPGGLVAFEVGIGQAQDVAQLLDGQGLAILETRLDIGGIPRAVVARNNSHFSEKTVGKPPQSD